MGMHRAGRLELDSQQLMPEGPTTAGSVEVCIDKQMGQSRERVGIPKLSFPPCSEPMF